MKRYRRKGTIFALRLALDMAPLKYQKWGGEQTAKPGDWLAQIPGDTYTIDADSFAATYEQVGPCEYRKTAIVWAEQAQSTGRIQTKEGFTEYVAGDWLVYNQPDRGDGYAMGPARFSELYEEL